MAYLYWIRHPNHDNIIEQGYVGITTLDVSIRWSCHKSAAKDPERNHTPVYNAINKYGAENLEFLVVLEGSEEYVLLMENRLRPTPGIGWNIAQGGQSTNKGRITSEETKKKQSLAKLGKKHTPEQRAAKSAYTKGRKHTEESKEKLSKALTGKKRTPEMLERLSISRKGKKASETTRAKLSERLQNAPWLASKRKSTWTLAGVIYKLFSEGKRKCDICRELGLEKHTIYTVFEHIKSGWIPQEDPAWLQFKEQYLTEQTHE